MVSQTTTIFQNTIFTNYILPFLLVFVLIFAILEKTKLFGEKKSQLNAIMAFVIGVIFTGFLASTQIVTNMVVFLAVALVILFVILMLWGFIFGTEKGFELHKGLKWTLAVVAGIAFVGAVLWATGVLQNLTNTLFQQSWSTAFWTNFLFVAIIVIVLFILLRPPKKS
jgi:hypothetical protein